MKLGSEAGKLFSGNSFSRHRPWLLVLLVLLFVGFIRFRLLDMPLERDEGEYAYAGQLILQGIPPYQLAYNMKLPGTYYACAAGMGIFGQTTTGLHLTLLVVNGLTIVFVFLLGRKIFGAAAGVAAAASYGVMTLNPEVLGLAAHATHFVVLFAVPAIWLMLVACERNQRPTLMLSGLLFGLAFLMKQHGFFFCVFGAGYLLWRQAHDKPRGAVWNVLLFGTAMILPFVLLCGLMKASGVFNKFWFWTFTYAHSYAALVPWPEGMRLLAMHLKIALPVSGFLWALAVAGLFLGLRAAKIRGQTIFIAAWWLSSFLGAAMGLYFRGHYFILVLPALSIWVGLALKTLQENLCGRMTPNGAKTIPVVLLAAAIGWSISCHWELFFRKSGEEACRSIYRGFPFVESLAVARYIEEHSSPATRVAVMGSEPQIYFYSHRHSATGYIYTYPLMEPQPDASQMQQQMIREIEAARPEYFVWVGYENSWWVQPSADKEIFVWFDKYIAGSYERVGLVDSRSDGKTTYLWGDEAKDYNGLVENYLTVYKRKTVAQ